MGIAKKLWEKYRKYGKIYVNGYINILIQSFKEKTGNFTGHMIHLF